MRRGFQYDRWHDMRLPQLVLRVYMFFFIWLTLTYDLCTACTCWRRQRVTAVEGAEADSEANIAAGRRRHGRLWRKRQKEKSQAAKAS